MIEIRYPINRYIFLLIMLSKIKKNNIRLGSIKKKPK